MKSLYVCLVSIFALPLFVLAGGNTSIVEIDKVSEIKIEERMITIKAGAVIRRRVMSTAEKSDTTVFGHPAQWIHAKVDNAVFVIVPYFTPGIEGVPTGGHAKDELKRQSEELWKHTLAQAAQIKTGNAITIGYQGDQTTINGVRITEIIGFGSFDR